MDYVFTLLGTFLFLAFIFLLFRALILWYWKVDKIVRNLDELSRNVKRIADTIGQSADNQSDEKI